MRLQDAVPGVFALELTCADTEAALGTLISSGLFLSDIHRKTELTFQCKITRKDYPVFSSVCEKKGYSFRILDRYGPYWVLKRIFSHPVLLGGVLVLLLIVLALPTRVLFIRVEGNSLLPTNKILSSAQNCGVSFFASRKDVRSEKIKNALLYALPELEWVGVNTNGCVATISVRERTHQQEPQVSRPVSRIVADRDGFLLSVTVTSGNPLCFPGQYVTAGQLLVSGYTDCGICIQATHSEAEILAQTTRNIQVLRPCKPLVRSRKYDTSRKYSLLLGKKRINLWKGSGIWDSSCGRIYKEKYAALPGGFQLPIALCIEEFSFYNSQPALENRDVHISLSSFAEDYMCRRMTSGTILSKKEEITVLEDIIQLDGIYNCQEMIGRVQQEQIGEQYGKNHGTNR